MAFLGRFTKGISIMKFSCLSVLICLMFLFVSSCGKKDDSIETKAPQTYKGDRAVETPNETDEVTDGVNDENSSTSTISYEYEFNNNGCSTGKHVSSSLLELCTTLQNDALNHGCALQERKDYFNEFCSASNETFKPTNLCYSNICVGDVVYTEQSYSEDVTYTVVGISLESNYPFKIKRNSDGHLYVGMLSGIYRTTAGFCHKGICVGDVVYTDQSYNEDITYTVVGISPESNYPIQVKRNSDGHFYMVKTYGIYRK